VITVEDWALVRRLAADGVAKAEIARKLGISRTTVLKAIASESPPRRLLNNPRGGGPW
jgi:DNA invertase Pin-like site-specific DNA recombinase